ncbi:MAG TPA: hypothetical protein VGG45_07030 [Terracidiphilus sp.]|jgi:hypothetical protein
MARTQVRLEHELRHQARLRASDLGVSFAEYIRILVRKDVSQPRKTAGIESIFDLGRSGRSEIAREKYLMVEEAIDFRASH